MFFAWKVYAKNEKMAQKRHFFVFMMMISESVLWLCGVVHDRCRDNLKVIL